MSERAFHDWLKENIYKLKVKKIKEKQEVKKSHKDEMKKEKEKMR
jgi:hypothetical protein